MSGGIETQFPTPYSRELIRTIRDFVRENREFCWSTAQKIFERLRDELGFTGGYTIQTV